MVTDNELELLPGETKDDRLRRALGQSEARYNAEINHLKNKVK